MRLTSDLGLSRWSAHYWRDQPSACPADPEDARTGQVNKEVRELLLGGGGGRRRTNSAPPLPEEPPSVYKYLYQVRYYCTYISQWPFCIRLLSLQILSGDPSPPAYPYLAPQVSRRSRDLAVCYALLAGRTDAVKVSRLLAWDSINKIIN